MRTAVVASIDYGLATLECGEERLLPAPPVLLAQARLAARTGVPLDTVLRRYIAGYTLLSDFLIEEAGGEISGAALQRTMRRQAVGFERLLSEVTAHYSQEDQGPDTSEQRRAERVERLLAGELLDTSEFAYDFDGHHLAAIAAGPSAEEAVRDVAISFDCRLLLVRHKAGTIWSWFGVRRALDPGEIADHVSSRWDPISLALGEPGRGLSGWRLTHRQASAALPIALRGNRRLVRYSDVALLASTLKDETLMASLKDLYLVPLSEERDGGAARRATLRAYFDAERNASSAAAAIGVSRQTVVSRLQALEERFGRPIGRWAVEMDVALRLDALTNPTPSRQADPP